MAFHSSHGGGHSVFPHHQGHVDTPHSEHSAEPNGEVVKIFCEANPDFNLGVRHHEVVLVQADENDPNQSWIKDESWSTRVSDSEGSSAFALVNKGSGTALRHLVEKAESPVTLERYEPGVLNEQILWTLGNDIGHGYRAIRPVSNTRLNLDADHASEKYGGVKDGNKVILFNWKNEPNQHWQLTRINHVGDHQTSARGHNNEHQSNPRGHNDHQQQNHGHQGYPQDHNHGHPQNHHPGHSQDTHHGHSQDSHHGHGHNQDHHSQDSHHGHNQDHHYEHSHSHNHHGRY